MIILILFVSLHAEAKQVCAPQSGGASFSMDCKLVSEEVAKKMQAEINMQKGIKNKKPTTTIGMYSGKPGFYVVQEGKSIDAIIMNSKAADKLLQAFEKSGSGQTRDCELEGMQQAIGYTVFEIIDCK
jgi:hypothetical protein